MSNPGLENIKIYIDNAIATMDPELADDFGLIENAALVVEDERIAWVGKRDALPAIYQQHPTDSLGGRLITPSFIDCHTHIVHGGDRAEEFALRLQGIDYSSMSKQGGIQSTVNATRMLTEDQLLQTALPRVDSLIAEGVSHLEIKSGYGLNLETEIKMLKVARRIGQERSIEVYTTFLGAHALPKEYKSQEQGADKYIDQVCLPTLKKAHELGLVDAVDGFLENIAFNQQQITRVFTLAKSLNIPIKLHAEQLSSSGAAAFAAKFGALSVDHLEYTQDKDIRHIAQNNSVAVLLPGAFYSLQETQKPPVESFRKHGVSMAVATDANPGSSPLFSLLLAANMSCTLFQLTPEEALTGITRNAALALGVNDSGQIKAGFKAHFSSWNISHPRELVYRIGYNPIHQRWYKGQQCN